MVPYENHIAQSEDGPFEAVWLRLVQGNLQGAWAFGFHLHG